jgi:hypothetical protein
MKTMVIVMGVVTAMVVLLISSVGMRSKTKIRDTYFTKVSPEFTWTQVAPPGSGTHQHEWKPGTYPSAIAPLVGMNNNLWMIGQKKAWTSEDGIRWEAFDKTDWGEKISAAQVYFNNKFWLLGGLEYTSATFLNDVWSSADGKNWTRITEHAEWSPRKGHALVAFNNKLWLLGGAIGVDKDKAPNKFINDIWSSDDGIRWTKVLDMCPWTARDNPRVVVFKGKLWIIGGQGHSDIWNSADGKQWTQVTTVAPWKNRYDYGALVFDNLLVVVGGAEENRRNAYKDVWFSIDGSAWRLQTDRAPWTARSGVNSIAYKEKLFLYGGKHTGHADSFSGDIWVMEAVSR